MAAVALLTPGEIEDKLECELGFYGCCGDQFLNGSLVEFVGRGCERIGVSSESSAMFLPLPARAVMLYLSNCRPNPNLTPQMRSIFLTQPATKSKRSPLCNRIAPCNAY